MVIAVAPNWHLGRIIRCAAGSTAVPFIPLPLISTGGIREIAFAKVNLTRRK